jgi:superfamily II DNA or RNA helicase
MSTFKASWSAQPWRDPRLWPHQQGAVKKIDDFLRDRQYHSGPAALVGMPTGTGKSGVIAVAAHLLETDRDVLLLTPWDALVDQLHLDVASRFWEKVGATTPTSKSILRIYPSTAPSKLDEHPSPVIWLSTVATLQRLHATGDRAYAALQTRLGLIMFDEGHYEPARSWSDAVRELKRPTVLFSATPYRNDIKYFVLDDAFRFDYSHTRAHQDHILRGVTFRPVRFHTVETFCDELLSCVSDLLHDHPRAKVIVRCDSLAGVNNVVNELNSRTESVIGIHEIFKSGDPLRLHKVPKPEDCQARFWVHQFKLTEGIDSPDFRAVAFYRPFKSERAFVQQVGRVLRNPGESTHDDGLVIFADRDRLDTSWNNYMAYDREAERGALKSPFEVARSQPSPHYYNNKFRTTFDFAAGVSPDALSYPRSVKILQLPADFDLDKFATEVSKNLEENDCLGEQLSSPVADMKLHVYLAIRLDPVLLRAAYYRSSLGFTVYLKTDKHLFFHDTYGLRPDCMDDYPLVDPHKLQHVLSGLNAQISSVSLSNTDLGRFSARRRTLHARSIADLSPDLSDHAQFATTSTGHFELAREEGGSRHVSRYVGFSRSRVSEQGSVEFDEFVEWLRPDFSGSTPRSWLYNAVTWASCG